MLFLKTDYTGANETQNVYCSRHLCLKSLSRINHCHLQPLQTANCCRNSRLVVNEDDLKGVKKKLPCIGKTVSRIFLF